MALYDIYDDLTARLRAAGDWVWPLALRLIMFWEFWEAGTSKYNGSNWFGNIQDNFPFPFRALGADLNWIFATYGEIIFSVLVLLGLFTRFAAVSLLVITVVATVAVHWPADWSSLSELWQGYAISDKGFGNFKLPLLFMIILLPLIFHGGGKISLDHLLVKFTGRSGELSQRIGDLGAAGLAFLVLGIATVYLLPTIGWTFLILGLGSLGAAKFLR